MAIPAMSQVKPTAMDIVVYEEVPIGGWECSEYNFSGVCRHCSWWLFDVCMIWTDIPFTYQQVYTDEVEVVRANVGDIRKVKGTISSDLPKNIKFKLTVTLKNKIIVQDSQSAGHASWWGL